MLAGIQLPAKGPWTEAELREFYDRWAASIFTFCRLQVGDRELAEAATGEAFVEYLRDRLPLDVESLPAELVRRAFLATCGASYGREEAAEDNDLRELLPALDLDERAVFILHGVLGLTLASAAVSIGMSHERARWLWFTALAKLRHRLHRERYGDSDWTGCGAASPSGSQAGRT